MFPQYRSDSRTKPMTPPTPDIDDTSSIIDDDVDVDVPVDLDVDVNGVLYEAVAAKKPHFLDYDAAPPPDFEQCFQRALNLHSKAERDTSTIINSSGEHLKLDKKYERDGEISDYELAASGYTKKEFTQDDNTLHIVATATASTPDAKPKHFLDENPIAPDYLLEHELREHRSLDRNFERQHEQRNSRLERKSSLERVSRSTRESRLIAAPPSYTLSRFIDNNEEAHNMRCAIPKGGAWSERYHDDDDVTSGAAGVAAADAFAPKVECVYSLLSMLGSQDTLEMSKKFAELSRTHETCAQLRRSGCVPLLVQMIHGDGDECARKYASHALHNVVHSNADEKAGRREAKVLRLLEQLLDYCNFLKTLLQSGGEAIADDCDRHPLAAISSLMKVSFDEEHRHAMCALGALQAIPSLVHLDHAVHGPRPQEPCCNSLRRYALMALTNLTFGDEHNKALLCSQKLFMEALVVQLDAAPDDLLQVTASVLRNLSWRADSNMKAVLNEIGTVTALARAAMKNRCENTLKAILSALWNLSAHCSTNKAEFCSVAGALAFLVDMLSYEGPSKTLKIIENSGGILRNVSSHIAVREHYRQILRERNCLSILLQQLKSESLTVVSNSCGTLWNLSARCPIDQKFLWDNGAVPMLRSLIHSKHAMISEGSSSALKNLLNFRPTLQQAAPLDPIARSMRLKQLPTLTARKQKALEQELSAAQQHAETCDNLDVEQTQQQQQTKQQSQRLFNGPPALSRLAPSSASRSVLLAKSESRDSVFSSKSDTAYEHILEQQRLAQPAPVDYALQYNESQTPAASVEPPASDVRSYAAYQETDIDQPTDFSLRYAENQLESDADSTPPDVTGDNVTAIDSKQQSVAGSKQQLNGGNEILILLEDSVKCYQTEDTPYVISNAASVSDLHQQSKADAAPLELSKVPPPPALKKYAKSNYGGGSYTPEKTINYCEEGTPGYFSRYESLSSLDESPPSAPQNAKETETSKEALPKTAATEQSPPVASTATSKVVASTNQINSALETPLMFSRHSSMDSIAAEDVEDVEDDKSSVVSEFSRLASGVISPYELPDSPTQSMPQSPKRLSMTMTTAATATNTKQHPPPVPSVFEDNYSTFHVENTPAQFSCATSLSNLSIWDDEHAAPTTKTTMGAVKTVAEEEHENEDAEEEEEEAETALNNDDILLASCINMGMSRNPVAVESIKHISVSTIADAPTHYYTEDTPALLSKVGSNTNLSTISICSNLDEHLKAEDDDEIIYATAMQQRHSLNLSDDVSSNASDAGDILQQCIRDGMQKHVVGSGVAPTNAIVGDPLDMFRRGGDKLPTYLAAPDEMNKFLVEDTPCNFSVVSALSNLTVGSSLIGPAIALKGNVDDDIDDAATVGDAACVNAAPTSAAIEVTAAVLGAQAAHDNRAEPPREYDSLSSLSIDSEDDTNLLSQAIAAGCNRPKSNLGFSYNLMGNSKRSTSLSASQPTSMNAAPSTCSLSASGLRPSRQQQRATKQQQQNAKENRNNNDSYSSVDSSDSNDNQSKSLFELCILSGMHKSGNGTTNNNHNSNSRSVQQLHSVSTTNLKTTKHETHHNYQPQLTMQPTPILAAVTRLHSDRARKDEQLLLECINAGISTKISGTPDVVATSSTASKNVQATSAAGNSAAQHSTAAADVESNKHMQATTATAVGVSNQQCSDDITDGQRNQRLSQALQTTIVAPAAATSSNSSNIKHNFIINSSSNIITTNSTKATSNANATTTTNATGYKAAEQPHSSSHSNDSSLTMDITEFSLKNSAQAAAATVAAGNKHKDPELMLRSVERLTQQFVASAEQLRSSNGATTAVMPSKRSPADTISSHSNNTWNEDTCPHDVSFPSVSITAPVVAATRCSSDSTFDDDDVVAAGADLDDATEADFRELHDFAEITPTCEQQQEFDSLELTTETLTLVEQPLLEDTRSPLASPQANANGINFMLGGAVQNASLPLHYNNIIGGNNNNAMNHSTIIALEARNLADNFLLQDFPNISASCSLDLDQVRPPSGMESLNMSGYFADATQQNSLQRNNSFKAQSPHLSAKSPKFPRKTLPSGLMARRALGQLPAGLSCSAESINSSCQLLDNIKPPSLMDELLDSMISVASIQSEIADCESLATTISLSNYETAAAGVFGGSAVGINSGCGGGGNVCDFDDNTMTLQSCCDDVATLPHDGDFDDDADDASINSGTLLPSDYEFSSAASTPRRSTGSVNGVKRTLTPKQRRKLAKDRFKTYTIAADIVLDNVQQQQLQQQQPNCYVAAADEDDETIEVVIEEHVLPQQQRSNSKSRSSLDRYKTQTIVCPLELVTKLEESTCNTYTINIKPEHESDYNSLEHDQNSETESCHGHGIDDVNHDNDDDIVNDAEGYQTTAMTTIRPKIIKPNAENHETYKLVENIADGEHSNKAVRGRKKPAYVSPYRMQYQQRTTAPTTTTKTKKGDIAATASKITAFQQRNTNSCIGNVAKTATPAATIAQNKKTAEPPSAPCLERQGTFVKEEPSISAAQVPVVDAVVSSPSNSRLSKLPTKKQIPSPKHVAKVTLRKLPTTPAAPITTAQAQSAAKNTLRKFADLPPQRSNSNASLKVTGAAAANATRTAALSARISSTTPPSRSNSTLNCASAPKLNGVASATNATKIQQTQSRIASIWKRVDEAKTKPQKTTAPTAIASHGNQLKSGTKSAAVIGGKQTKLVRSSTFDTTPPPQQTAANQVAVVPPPAVTKISARGTKTLQSKIAVNKTSIALVRRDTATATARK